MGEEQDAVITSQQEWVDAVCAVFAGDGTTLRLSGVVMVIGPASGAEIRGLVDLAESVVGSGGDGAQLVRRAAAHLGLPGARPSFVAMGPVGDGLAVISYGDSSVTVDGEELTSRDALAWRERLFPWPIGAVVAHVSENVADDAGSGLDLRAGVVPGAGLSMRPAQAKRSPDDHPGLEAPPADDDREAVGADEVPPIDDPIVEQPSAGSGEGAAEAARPPRPMEPAAAGFDSILLGARAEGDVEERSPLPVVNASGGDAALDSDPSMVRGVFCKNRHFNDPRVLFCAVCGVNMVHQTPLLVAGVRPPLGVLVLDDGAVFQVDANYLIGRDPESDDRVRSGRYRALSLADAENQISRVHARLEMVEWDVVLVDNGSTNGTLVATQGADRWQSLPPGSEYPLTAGSRVRIGARTLTFTGHRGE